MFQVTVGPFRKTFFKCKKGKRAGGMFSLVGLHFAAEPKESMAQRVFCKNCATYICTLATNTYEVDACLII